MGQAASEHTLTKTEIAALPRRELSEDPSSMAKLGALPRSDPSVRAQTLSVSVGA